MDIHESHDQIVPPARGTCVFSSLRLRVDILFLKAWLWRCIVFCYDQHADVFFVKRFVYSFFRMFLIGHVFQLSCPVGNYQLYTKPIGKFQS